MTQTETVAGFIAATICITTLFVVLGISDQSARAKSVANMAACVQAGGIYVDSRDAICVPAARP